MSTCGWMTYVKGRRMKTVEDPKIITYRFHEFRPSDRAVLKQLLTEENGQQAFVAALGIYMRKWAEASWLTEYDLERIAQWTAIHFPSAAQAVESMASRELAGAQNEQAKKTYFVMAEAIKNTLRTPA
jgi:hypothetical protein